MFDFTVEHFANGYRFEWNGSKTVNVFHHGANIDAFSLDYRREVKEDEVIRLCNSYVFHGDES